MSNSDKIDGLLTKIKPIENPVLIGLRIAYFTADGLKQRTLSLYEGFLINDEYLDFQRTGYIQPAWNLNFKASIKICIELLNQAFLARIFNEADLLKKYTEWGMEAYRLNSEKRKHYILDNYLKLLRIEEHRDLLEDLVKVRNRYPNTGETPCHVESFPYQFYSPEGILLGQDKTEHSKNVSKEIVILIAELVLRH